MPIDKTTKRWVGPSNSDQYLETRSSLPSVSTPMSKAVSEYRKQSIANEVERGLFRDGSSPRAADNEYASTFNGRVISGMSKAAQAVGGSGGGFRGGFGDTAMQTPEVYSPLWLNSNLSLPRDRATINAWCRSFYALNPFVHNAINLHSTYPIAKLNIKCPNKDIEKFFNDMIEEIDLMNICVQIAQEYWLLGEAFVYAELDEGKGKWSRLMCQNPDYVIVKRTVVADEPMIMLRPDENLKKIVMSNRPADIEQRRQLNPHIIDSVKRGQNIPLDNFHVSHLARRISPYEIRGTGLPTCIFRQLMLFDQLRESKYAQASEMINPMTLVKVGTDAADGLHPTFADLEAYRDVFECHDEETEVLTDQGFKKFDEVIEYQEAMDGTTGTSRISQVMPEPGVKIACFNPQNGQLEYHEPSAAHVHNYDGEMYHFMNKKVDIKVTPNHDMWVSEKEREYHGHPSLRKTYWGEWKKIKAKDLKLTDYKKFRSKIGWSGNDTIQSVDVLGKQVPIELYLEFLGYVLSEGCLYTNDAYQHTVGLCQTTPKFHKEMSDCMNRMSACIEKSFSERIEKRTEYTENCSDLWSGVFSGKALYEHFKNEVQGSNGGIKCYDKRMPRWVMDLSPRLMTVLLKALVMGDGSVYDNPKKTSNHFEYYSTSKQLADDVYEVVYKCGFVPTMFTRDDENYLSGRDHEREPLHVVSWSNFGKGEFPQIYKNSRNALTKEKHDTFRVEQYSGKVWCFTVPTGLFITRRNGKITIQGNSAQNNKNFKIFTHAGLTVERVGWGQGIYDISGDITQLMKEIFIGLQVPPVAMGDSADTTYSNGGVALEVLRQRYMQFRYMLAAWLKRKIFAPISKIQGFYDYSGGEKQLIVPEVDWNHMSLFDTSDFLQILLTLTTGTGDQKRASLHTLYRSAGLDYEDEQRKIRKETIQAAILKREVEALGKMDLNSLRALDEDDEISEPKDGKGEAAPEAPLPGEAPGGLPGMDLGAPPPPPPSAPPEAAPPPAAPPPAAAPPA